MQKNSNPEKQQSGKSEERKGKSMHEDVGEWVDPCPCEAEPRWQEVGERQGMDQSPSKKDQEKDGVDE